MKIGPRWLNKRSNKQTKKCSLVRGKLTALVYVVAGKRCSGCRSGITSMDTKRNRCFKRREKSGLKRWAVSFQGGFSSGDSMSFTCPELDNALYRLVNRSAVVSPSCARHAVGFLFCFLSVFLSNVSCALRQLKIPLF